MKVVEAKAAVAAIPDHTMAIMPGGCASADGFFKALVEDIERFSDLTLCTGFRFGPYTFLEKGLGTHCRYLTWQASGRIRDLFTENDPAKIGYVPIRLGDVHRVISRAGQIVPHTVVVQTTPPQNDGTVSLGISVGPYPDFIRDADLVIAELNPNMPATSGASRIALDDVDLAYEADTPLLEYSTPAMGGGDAAIVDHVMDLIPNGAWVQLGIGSVPDRIMDRLSELRDINLFSGLLTGGLGHFMNAASHTPQVVAGELAGTRDFYDFCDGNTAIDMAATRVTHDVAKVAELPRFVSINSALEIDLQGQSNGEAIGNVQISGPGGSLDYIEAAALSLGGVSIIALPSTTANGKRSKIVAAFERGAVVTTPRFCTDYVVTEYGVARLRGKTLHQRAEALIGIAHPDFRDELSEAIR